MGEHDCETIARAHLVSLKWAFGPSSLRAEPPRHRLRRIALRATAYTRSGIPATRPSAAPAPDIFILALHPPGLGAALRPVDGCSDAPRGASCYRFRVEIAICDV